LFTVFPILWRGIHLHGLYTAARDCPPSPCGKRVRVRLL
jgi:hypothetical protein